MNTKKLKTRVYKILQPQNNYIGGAVFNWFIIFLVVNDVFTTIIETSLLPGRVLNAFILIEYITVAIFTVEYLSRLWTADMMYPEKNSSSARLKYAFTLMMLVDFMAIAPFYLHFLLPIDVNILRVFRVLRVLRLIKVNQYVKALSSVGEVLKKKSLQLLISIFIIFTLMIVASILMYTVEHDAQPEVFTNALSGLWWAATTISTIGYGDIYPVTVLGKIFGTIFSLLNIGLIAVPTGIISAGFIEDTGRKYAEKRKIKRYCPYCGENIDE